MEEKVILSAGANLYSFSGSKGGKLTLTNRKVIFKGNLAYSKTQIEMPLYSILKCDVEIVSGGLFAMIFPIKVVNITLNDGTNYKFRVTKQKEWVDEILTARNQQR